MLAIAPASTRHHPAGEFIDDHRFVVADDVIHILDEQLLGFEGIGDVVRPGVLGVEQITNTQQLLSLGVSLVRQRAAALLLVDLVVTLWIDAVFAHLCRTIQRGSHLGRLLILLLGPLHLARNDQRRTGLIDQDRIDLVNHTELEFALHHLREVGGHVVAQVIKPQFGVCGVGDVAGVVATAFLGPHVLLDQANTQAKEAMHLAHPLSIATGEVVVHRHHVHTATGQGVEVAGQGGDQGFAFAGFHLSDLALMQDHAADELHIEVTHPQDTLAGFAHDGERFGKDFVENGALVLE